MQLEDHILDALAHAPRSGRPTTVNDLARRFGTSPAVMQLAARRLVDNGRARPVTVERRGEQVLLGLFAADHATPVPRPA